MSRNASFNVEHYHSGDLTNQEVTTSRVDASLKPSMRNVYRNGQCHALALAIHHQAGHPIGVVHLWGSPNHFFNYDKNDHSMGIDVDGRRPVKDIVKEYGESHRQVTPNYVMKKTSEEKWLNAHHEAAHAVAPTVLNTLTSPTK